MPIPISDLVTINPGVVGTGGNPLSLNGVILSKNAYLPSAGLQSFASADSVSSYFGSSSTEYGLAQKYFLGYDNSQAKPSTLFFAPFADVARAAWNRSGSFAGWTLAQLQALGSGTLIVTVDGTQFTSSSIALGAVASFTAAATAITAAFTGVGKPTCTWDAVNSTFSLTSSTTGATSTIGYATGTLSTGLKFTSATGATLSQGKAIDTPATAMANIKATSTNWVSFMTLWEPVLADKTSFADWTNSQNQRFAYVAWDTDAQAIVNGSTTHFAYAAKTANYDGVLPVYNTPELAASVLGFVASLDFNRINGRATLAHKGQAGLSPTVTDQQISQNLLANGYTYYGTYANATNQANRFFDGKITGRWLWLDSFVGEVFLNSQLQTALFTLLGAVNAIPYNEQGFALIRSAMIDPINQALTSGIIRTGVTLSEAQKSQVNSAAGVDVSDTLFNKGYFLQIKDPGTQARGQRTSPTIYFWYTDGQAVQKITMPSVAIL